MRLSEENLDGFKKSFTYSGNNISSIAYSIGNSYICSENFTYSYGHKSNVSMNGSASIWALGIQNNRGLVNSTSSGPLNFAIGYDTSRNLTSCSVRKGRLLRHSSSYVYDTATGNMTVRTVAGQSEQFTYDGMNRLTGDGMSSVAYDDLGNTTSVTAAGMLTYGGSSPYALTFLDVTGTSVPLRNQSISYNAMQLPDTITENGITASFTYRGDGTRSGMTVTAGGSFLRQVEYRDRLMSYVKRVGDIDNTRDVLWLGGTPYDAPAALVRDNGSAWTLHRVIRDNLGSIVAVTDSVGDIEQRIAYDAWGRLRDLDTGDCFDPDEQPELMLGHGYTGHEHLPWFGLINMNARLYDPAVHRFLSPDPEVQLPDNTQNYNRYTYCLNNPLRYSDPTGRIIKISNDLILLIETIYAALPPGANILIRLNNDKTIDASSIEEFAQTSDDLFIQDLYMLSSCPEVVELYNTEYNVYQLNNRIVIEHFGLTTDYNDYDLGADFVERFQSLGIPMGITMTGNFGQTLYPAGKNASISEKMSLSSNIQILLNSNATLQQKAITLAHEFGHAILYLNGLPHGHGEPGVDEFIKKRENPLKFRYGYAF